MLQIFDETFSSRSTDSTDNIFPFSATREKFHGEPEMVNPVI